MCNEGIQVFKSPVQKIYNVPKFNLEWWQHIILHRNLPLNAEK